MVFIYSYYRRFINATLRYIIETGIATRYAGKL
jgi:hypothetical protein